MNWGTPKYKNVKVQRNEPLMANLWPSAWQLGRYVEANRPSHVSQILCIHACSFCRFGLSERMARRGNTRR